MEFIVRDRASVEHGVLVRSSYIVISIRDPDKQRARIPKHSGLRDVLYLSFHDAEPATNMALPPDIILMTPEQAAEIWDFVRKWEGQVGAVLIHCEQGASRSPAVAAALCREYGGDETCFFREYQPNRYVFRLMLECQREDQPER